MCFKAKPGSDEIKDGRAEEIYLFNLESDPTERINLAVSLPDVVKQLEV